MNTAMYNGCFGVIIQTFAVPLAFKITSKVCTPKFESNKIC